MVNMVMGMRLFGLRHLMREAARGSNNSGGSGAINIIILIAVIFALWYLIVPRLRVRRRNQQQQQRVTAFSDAVEQPRPERKATALPLGVGNRDEFMALARQVQAAIDQRDTTELTRYTTKQAWTQLTRGWTPDAGPQGYTELTFDDLQRVATPKDELHIRATITRVTMRVGASEPDPAQTTTQLWELQRSEHGWVVNKITPVKK
ncbi:hypothetical protein [Lacticaseibacillus thailandensis]|uniref:Tim44-like domain-containing protein n=1 Tax=Lacticaseibacillus thailandensis DSM 22698 = JCM 13996 TaxID=1423810 RepID=A0A0R2C4Y5_9LACO|nr:hypothetical protein [Lacticaseibacillus thailandensis]KRM86567.1 hypothetical protein FD19_GL001881 [Lacticaseibacillus thailandensis DSM 22698 = JCM 13996]